MQRLILFRNFRPPYFPTKKWRSSICSWKLKKNKNYRVTLNSEFDIRWESDPYFNETKILYLENRLAGQWAQNEPARRSERKLFRWFVLQEDSADTEPISALWIHWWSTVQKGRSLVFVLYPRHTDQQPTTERSVNKTRSLVTRSPRHKEDHGRPAGRSMVAGDGCRRRGILPDVRCVRDH